MVNLREDWLCQFPLRTRGRYIVNQYGERFKLAGVNWAGASDVRHVVGGLDIQPLPTICQAIADIGFNVVRLPFSNQMLRYGVTVLPAAIDYDLNPGLEGLTPLEVLDHVVDSLAEVGVAVILNNHTSIGMWSGGAEANGLWFLEGDAEYTEEQWISDWLLLAKRYRDRPYVVGYDLRNEVRPTSLLGVVGASSSPDWGSGGELDWMRAAGACARALAWEASGLLIVERLAWPQQSLAEMLYPLPPWKAWDVPKDRIVLALHSYAWSGPGCWTPKHFTGGPVNMLLHAVDWIGDKKLYGELEESQLHALMDTEWGRFLDEDLCPIWLSEFGADMHKEVESQWFDRICRYLESKDADFAYWPLNVGPKPGGEGDESYGLLTNDWLPRWADARVQALRQLMPQRAAQGESFEVRNPFLAPLPWCAPLPGPLVPWPEDGPLMATEEVPAARQLWLEFKGKEVDGSSYPDAQGFPLAELMKLCLQGDFGGFAVASESAYMRRGCSEALQLQLQDARDPNITSFYIHEEVRPCAMWSVVEELPAHWKADSGFLLEVPGGREALFRACYSACLTHGLSGFELFVDKRNVARLYPRPGESTPMANFTRSRDISDKSASSQISKAKPQPNSRSLRTTPVCNCCCVRSMPPLATSPKSPVLPKPRRFHVMRRAYIQIGLQSYPEHDAFPGSDSFVIQDASFSQCRQCCLEGGFGGFALYLGDAYFRTASGRALQRHLQPGFPNTTFYILVAEDILLC